MPDAGHDAKPGQRGMGRGLAAILPRSRADESGLREIPLELVTPNPRQLEVGVGPGAMGIMVDHRLAEARCLADPHIAWDDGVEDELGKM